MNRIYCGACGEDCDSPLLAEELEGLQLRCLHCDTMGRVAARENGEGGLSMLELIATEERVAS